MTDSEQITDIFILESSKWKLLESTDYIENNTRIIHGDLSQRLDKDINLSQSIFYFIEEIMCYQSNICRHLVIVNYNTRKYVKSMKSDSIYALCLKYNHEIPKHSRKYLIHDRMTIGKVYLG